MQNDLRFPSAKNFFTTLGWLSVIALLAVVVVNALYNSSFKSWSDISVKFTQTDLIFLITFAIIAIVCIIISLLLKLLKHP